jgi:ferritin
MKFYRYLIERGGTVKLQAIAQPDSEFDSALEIYQATLKHEQFITSKINELVDIARKENDNATLNMLQWFVDEQVEEEANASELVDKLTLVGDNNASLFMIDKDLSARVFVDETVSG